MPEPQPERLRLNPERVIDADDYLTVRAVLAEAGYTDLGGDHWIKPSAN